MATTSGERCSHVWCCCKFCAIDEENVAWDSPPTELTPAGTSLGTMSWSARSGGLLPASPRCFFSECYAGQQVACCATCALQTQHRWVSEFPVFLEHCGGSSGLHPVYARGVATGSLASALTCSMLILKDLIGHRAKQRHQDLPA